MSQIGDPPASLFLYTTDQPNIILKLKLKPPPNCPIPGAVE